MLRLRMQIRKANPHASLKMTKALRRRRKILLLAVDARNGHPARLHALNSTSMLDPTATLILDWLRKIGLTVRLAPLDADTFLPGVTLEPDGLIVDPERLLYPGDLLHEAGHLATMLPAQRASTGSNAGSDIGGEIAAQTWSYAAAVHLGLPPETVFHPTGYKGAAQNLIQIYQDGNAGIPLLQWMGLTLDSTRAVEASIAPYPHMIRWLRGQPE
jgi:hypothetical protein